MPDEIKINGKDNIIVQGVGKGATVEVTQILAKSYEYNDLLDKLKTKQKLFERTPEDDTEERLQISAEIDQLKETFEQFKRDVLALAETFNKIEISTDRLLRAKEFFDKGEIGEARAVLEMDIEPMQNEQAHWLRLKEHYDKDVLPNLLNNSDEFFLLAMATQTNYDNSNRFGDTCKYFETSIKSYPHKDNVFQYAVFLQEHNQFKEAERYYSQYLNDFSSQLSEANYATTLNNLAILHKDQNYYEDALQKCEKALEIYRKLAETNPNIYLPSVAMTLNNLAILHSDQNNYEDALQECEEALKIYRKLAEANPNTYLPNVAMTLNNLAMLHQAQKNSEDALQECEEALKIRRKLAEANPNTYLPDVAMTLNNLATLHQAQKNNEDALQERDEALKIYRKLAETNPNTYLPYVAPTLNNLAVLHSDQNNYEDALQEYDEALKINRKLAEPNPNTYLPDVAMTLNNLAILHQAQKNNEDALQECEEALKIYRKFAETNPNTYLPYVAGTLINLSIYFKDAVAQREKSLEYAIEAMYILLPFVEKFPFTQRYLESAQGVFRDWELSFEEISKILAENDKGTREITEDK